MSKGIGLQSQVPSSGLQALQQDELVMPFQPGEILNGKYEVVELIGAGGMGFVVSALHLELGEKVALKFLRPEAMSNAELVGRFAREARASVRIKSEYVARVFDVGSLPDGAPFIVMEYLEGKDLADVVRDEGPLPVKRAVEYMLQACEALASAHATGVVHRDVKPENVFLVQASQGMDVIKVLDFGISKVALTGSVYETKMPMVKTIMPMGSPVYMSPEQIRAKKDIDARTDIWALGCTLYELLAGVAAFDAPSLTQITAAILETDPPSLQTLCSLVPPELEAVVWRCLQKDPNNRFQNVGELAVALYPFAPRRARISVERCSAVLKSVSLPQTDFELPSIPPPRSGTGTGVGIPGAQAAMADPVVSTGTTSQLLLESGANTHKLWKPAAIAGLGIAVLASLYAIFGRHDATPTAPTTDATHAAVAPAAALPVAPVTAPAAAPQAAAAPVAPALTAAATALPMAAEATALVPGRNAAPPVVAAPQRAARNAAPPQKTRAPAQPAGRPASSTTHSGDSVDVGF
jgi:serine/threonine-protein kinase